MDLPAPERPTTATVSPGATTRLNPATAGRSRVEYVKLTSRNVIGPLGSGASSPSGGSTTSGSVARNAVMMSAALTPRCPMCQYIDISENGRSASPASRSTKNSPVAERSPLAVRYAAKAIAAAAPPEMPRATIPSPTRATFIWPIVRR